ncbi:hypothetical protein BH23CHL5_BH23CHL5_21980 [soil metagenome]
MARHYQRYLDHGAILAGVVIDSPQQNAAMVQKLALPFPILNDPEGTSAIRPFDVWDANGKMSRPATIALAPDGQEVYRYVGIDLVDRPIHEEALQAVSMLGLEPIMAPLVVPNAPESEPGPRAASVAYVESYMRGVRSSTNDLSARMRNEEDREDCARTARMAEIFIAALAETARVVRQKEDPNQNA